MTVDLWSRVCQVKVRTRPRAVEFRLDFNATEKHSRAFPLLFTENDNLMTCKRRPPLEYESSDDSLFNPIRRASGQIAEGGVQNVGAERNHHESTARDLEAGEAAALAACGLLCPYDRQPHLQLCCAD